VLRDRAGQGTAFERMIGRMGRTSREARSFAGHESTAELRAVAPPPTEMISSASPARAEPREGTLRKIRSLLRVPGIRLAFWMHFTPPFANNAMLLLWGTPFFTGGIGLSPAASAGLLSIAIFAGMAAGVTLGPITSRFVERRVRVVTGLVFVIVGAWLLVLLWPGTPPYWTLLVLVLITPAGSPASMVAFEVARSHAPRSYLGLATGLVNMGGFISSLIVILLVGLALDAQGAGSPEDYSLPAFRVAMAMQLPVWALGLVMLFIERRRTGRWMSRHGRTLR